MLIVVVICSTMESCTPLYFKKSLQAHHTPIVLKDVVLLPVPKTCYPKIKRTNKFSCSHIGCDESSETCEVRDFKTNWTCAWPPL